MHKYLVLAITLAVVEGGCQKMAEAPASSAVSPAQLAMQQATMRRMTSYFEDVDAILDNIHDDTSLEAAKPKILARTKALGEEDAKPVAATDSSPADDRAAAFQTAMERHKQAIERVAREVPAAGKFMNREIGPLMMELAQPFRRPGGLGAP
jgi:hypothetical protein